MLNVVIIGTGAISDQHIQAYQKFSDQCQIVGVCDLYPEKARKKAAKYGLEVPIFDDYCKMITELEFDLASVCVPPFSHAEVSIDLLNAGKHVLLEKPMGTSLEECDRMIEASKTNAVLLSVVAQNRFKDSWMKLKQIVDSGKIGKIHHARIDSFWWRGSHYYDLWWRGAWEKEGGGCTLNHAVHHIDLFQWILGMPGEVQAVITNLAHENSEVEDFSASIFYFPDGSIGQVTASLVHYGEQQEMVVQAEKAMIAIPWDVKTSQQMANGFPQANPAFESELQSFYERLPTLNETDHVGQIKNFISAILGKEELLVDGTQGRNTIELITAIYQSGTLGERVSLPLSPNSPFYTQKGIWKHAPHFHKKTLNIENFETDEISFGRNMDQA
jgi:UDP-N-acetyl-2-amino-2-deoxyglucuronate dehydrogenase